MSKSGGGGTQTQTQTSGPPAYLTPYLKEGASEAERLYKAPGPLYFSGSTVADQSPETLAGLQGTANRAINGSPVNSANSSYLTSVLNGDYLNKGNPHEAALTQSISDRIMPQVASQFSAGGRYGSPSQGSEFTSEFTDALAPLLFSNYQGERANQQQASSLAPGAANQDYVDTAALTGVGAARDAQGQAKLSDEVNRYDYGQNLPADKLTQFLSWLNGNYGTTGTVTSKTPGSGGSDIASILGGALGLGAAFV